MLFFLLHLRWMHAKVFKQLCEGGYGMSRVCAVSGKKAMSGNRRSHSLRATRRRWNVNLQKVHMVVDGKPTTVRISARALKTLKGAGKKAKAAVAE